MKFTITILLLSIGNFVYAQTLTLQNNYGNAGVVKNNLSNESQHFSFAIGKQSDDKIIIAGSTLLRLNSNGNVDSSFGTNGLAIKADVTEIAALAVQPDDKIVVAQNVFSQILIKRFNANGLIDPSFNATGIVPITVPGYTIQVAAIKILPDGKILLAGSAYSDGKSKFFIARYLSNGQADAAFSGNGFTITDIDAGSNEAFDIAIQSSGKIVAAGFAEPALGNLSYLAIIRLNEDGSRDMNFNGNGIIQYQSSVELANRLHIYEDDKILIAGRSGTQLLLMRFLAEGGTDNSFANNGIRVAAGLGEAAPKDLLLLNDNSIVIPAQSSLPGGDDWQYAVFKFDADGNADNSFNGTGFTHFAIAGNDYCAGGIVQNNGNIILTGKNENIAYANTVRVSSAGFFDAGYGSAGIKDLKVNGTDETVYSILKQTDGKLLAVGMQTDLLASFSRTVVMRHNTNGSIDNSFGVNGIFNYNEPGFVYHSALLQTDGKIILIGDKAGEAPDYFSSICVTRLNSNGSIDNSFGTAGKAMLT
ncbi:MAG: hypothetical protein EOP53_15400, partial [Sphingobacteriales bacterium]